MTPARVLFRKLGLRCTPERETIFNALSQTTSHPTAEELHEFVNSTRWAGVVKGPISRATVYNTLDLLVRRGLARRFSFPSDDAGVQPARYDADTSEHVHLIIDDGRIRDVPDDLSARLLACLPPEVVEELEQRMGVQVDGLRIELQGRSTAGKSC
jgi:Fe2+ or Zn2+ uptake regulation protein